MLEMMRLVGVALAAVRLAAPATAIDTAFESGYREDVASHAQPVDDSHASASRVRSRFTSGLALRNRDGQPNGTKTRLP